MSEHQAEKGAPRKRPDETQTEFAIRAIQAETWVKAINHVENFLDANVRRAAMLDNPYLLAPCSLSSPGPNGGAR